MQIISVIVCTYNRSESLRETLKSLQEMSVPPDLSWELIVVDNHSSDNTKEIVEDFSRISGLNVRYIHEGTLGLSRARNTGIAHARGEIVAFIDDDAIADKAWLLNLVKAYEEENEAGCVGGRIILRWPVRQPLWWHADLDEVFNALHYSPSRILLHYPRYPYGTNISFRRDVLKKVGGFRIDLGRIGTKLLAGEEMDLCLRVEHIGASIYFEPKAIVHHRVEPKKLNKTFIRKRAFWHGRSHALIELEHFGYEYVSRKVRDLTNAIRRWAMNMRYPIEEQKHYLFFMGYVVEGIQKKLFKGKG